MFKICQYWTWLTVILCYVFQLIQFHRNPLKGKAWNNSSGLPVFIKITDKLSGEVLTSIGSFDVHLRNYGKYNKRFIFYIQHNYPLLLLR